VQYYEGHLHGQAAGRWKALPPQLIEAVQAAYSVDLNSVLYAEGMRTSNGDAQTFGRFIYFPTNIDLTDRNSLLWMLHELEHVVQYAGRKDRAAALCEYIAKSVGSGFQHDKIDWERAADAKADALIDRAYQIMNQVATGGLWTPGTLARNQVEIVNDTDRDVVFMMATHFITNAEQRIPARSSSVFTGDPRDSSFNVRIGTDTSTGTKWNAYALEGGMRKVISYDAAGILDFYRE